MSGHAPATVTVLCGGLGGARLAMATVEACRSATTTFVTNVADDWNVGGLLVCPDTDAVLYALSDRFDAQRGWGVVGDVFPGPRASEPSWFGIGEFDRVTHQRRAALLASGLGLGEATQRLAADAGVDARVIPVTGDAVRTRIMTDTGWHAFQEWMVRDRGPDVRAVQWHGLDHALPSAGVIDALQRSDVVVIASSSPIASLAPILGVAGVREELLRRSGPTVALSPMVLGRPPVTDRDRHRESARRRLMAAAGVQHDPAAVATWLAPLVTHFVVDPTDVAWCDAIGTTGARPLVAPVIGIDAAERRSLVDLFDSMGGWRRSPVVAMARVS
jgi:LPPG:FO 2-phospho-L-lactate transferase